MSTYLNPYLSFRGEAREAMGFYESVLGGKLEIMSFADMGGMGVPEDEAQQVMHSALTVSESVILMGADVPSHMEADLGDAGRIRIALNGDDVDTLRGWFDGLAVGGTVNVPLEKAPWGDWFGDLTDRYGVSWMVNISGSTA
jgi:PhnB protein